MGDCPLVIIRWLDSRQPCGQWRYLSALPDARPVEVASVGWLVKDTEDMKVICQNIGDLGTPEKAQASGIMTIPTRCVLSVERLTEEGRIIYFLLVLVLLVLVLLVLGILILSVLLQLLG